MGEGTDKGIEGCECREKSCPLFHCLVPLVVFWFLLVVVENYLLIGSIS